MKMMLLNPRRKRRAKKTASRKRRASRRTTPVAAAPRRKRRTSRRARRAGAKTSRVSFRKLKGTAYLRTNPRRRRYSSSGMAGGVMGTFKDILSKDNLMLAGGVIAAPALNQIVTTRLGSKLPGANSTVGQVAYTIGIPVVAAYFLRSRAPSLAKGLLIGATTQGILTLFGTPLANLVASASGAGTGTGTNEYIGEYLPNNTRAVNGISYDGMKTFGASPHSVFQSDPAFPNSAWDTTF